MQPYIDVSQPTSQRRGPFSANGCHRKATLEAKGSRSYAAIVAGLFVALGSSADAATQSVAAPRASSCSANFVSKANAMLESYLAKSRAPGVAVAFFDNRNACVLVSGVSGIKGERTSGPVTPKTAFA